MIIKKEPVAQISITKKGKTKIKHYSAKNKEPCIYCGTLTKNRLLGIPECPECVEYEYSKCSKCKYGFEVQQFCCNGNDIEDHFEYYTACAMRDYYGKLRDKPDFDNKPTAWGISPKERKKCFKPRNFSEKKKRKNKIRVMRQKVDDWIDRNMPRCLFQKYLNRKFRKLRLQFEKNHKIMN